MRPHRPQQWPGCLRRGAGRPVLLRPTYPTTAARCSPAPTTGPQLAATYPPDRLATPGHPC